jgi:hypothetical protein
MTAQPPDEGVPHNIEHGLELRESAKALFSQGLERVDAAPKEAEGACRSALGVAASALNWLEETEFEEIAHAELDELGRQTRERFRLGCRLDFTAGRYEHHCPVAIAHKRLGFSISFIAKRKECSICGGDFSECDHLPGRQYAVVATDSEDGHCSICGRMPCPRHIVGETYEASAGAIIREAEIDEISLVGRPAQPDARLIALPIDTNDLMDALGPGFKVGMRVDCSRCLLPCHGLERPFG